MNTNTNSSGQIPVAPVDTMQLSTARMNPSKHEVLESEGQTPQPQPANLTSLKQAQHDSQGEFYLSNGANGQEQLISKTNSNNSPRFSQVYSRTKSGQQLGSNASLPRGSNAGAEPQFINGRNPNFNANSGLNFMSGGAANQSGNNMAVSQSQPDNQYSNVMFPIGYCDHIDPEKYNQLYNRLDFLEKKIAIQSKVRQIRLKQQQTVDVPQALNEAARRGIFTNTKLFNLNSQHESMFTQGSLGLNQQASLTSPISSRIEVRKPLVKPPCERSQKQCYNTLGKSHQTFFTTNSNQPDDLKVELKGIFNSKKLVAQPKSLSGVVGLSSSLNNSNASKSFSKSSRLQSRNKGRNTIFIESVKRTVAQNNQSIGLDTPNLTLKCFSPERSLQKDMPKTATNAGSTRQKVTINFSQSSNFNTIQSQIAGDTTQQQPQKNPVKKPDSQQQLSQQQNQSSFYMPGMRAPPLNTQSNQNSQDVFNFQSTSQTFKSKPPRPQGLLSKKEIEALLESPKVKRNPFPQMAAEQWFNNKGIGLQVEPKNGVYVSHHDGKHTKQKSPKKQTILDMSAIVAAEINNKDETPNVEAIESGGQQVEMLMLEYNNKQDKEGDLRALEFNNNDTGDWERSDIQPTIFKVNTTRQATHKHLAPNLRAGMQPERHKINRYLHQYE